MLRHLSALLDRPGLLTGADDMAPYLVDVTGQFRGQALAVVRPASTAQVAAIVCLCAEHGTAITPRGGGTGFCGGAIPAAGRPHVLLSLERMRAMRAVDPVNDTIIAEAGCTLAQVRAEAERIGRLFPVSHGGEGSAQIGGMIATNAGGNNVVRYAMARAHVLGLEVVLADGTVWNGLRLLRKDNAGYDLKQLFIGSEGTLGIVTAAALALRQAPVAVATAFVAVADPRAALDLFVALRASLGELLSAFELMPRAGLDLHFARRGDSAEPLPGRHAWTVLVEAETTIPSLELDALLEAALAPAFETGLARDGVIARSQAQRRSLWALREGLAEAQASNERVLKSDTAVPVGASPDFVDRASEAVGRIMPGATPIPFGHVGDGNIHFNVLAPAGMDTPAFVAAMPRLSRAIHAAALALGGTISAEHGLGQAKLGDARVSKPKGELDLFARIRGAFDPGEVLNPGKLVCEDRPDGANPAADT